jgi:threonine/homoserine/homoserine lactone efflux protein
VRSTYDGFLNSLSGSRDFSHFAWTGFLLGAENVTSWFKVAWQDERPRSRFWEFNLRHTFSVNRSFGPSALTFVKFLGGSYIFYLGIRILFNHLKRHKSRAEDESFSNQKTTGRSAYWSGFLSTVLNGKAAVYFFSIVPQFINAKRTPTTNVILYFEFIILSAIWFFTVSEIAASSRLKSRLTHAFNSISLITGFIFIIFGLLLLCDSMSGMSWA